MKKIISLLLCLALCLSLGTMAFAEDDDSAITKIYLVEDGVWEEISYEEYCLLTAGDELIHPIDEQPPQIVPTMHTWYEYNYKREYDYFGGEIPVSYIVHGGASGASITQSMGFSVTITATVSQAVTASIMEAIQFSSEISESISLEASTALSSTFNVSPNKYGRIFFRPHMNRVIGDVETWVTYETGVTGQLGSEEVYADFPIVNSYYADGIYLLRESNNPGIL